MITKAELRGWLETLPDDELVYVEEGGLSLRAYASSAYIEVGGNPDEEEFEEEEERCPCDAGHPERCPDVGLEEKERGE